MDEELLLQQISELKSMVEGTRPLFKEYLRNRRIPLNVRWTAFKQYGGFLLETNEYVIHFQSMNSTCQAYQERFHVEKHERVPFLALIEIIKEGKNGWEHRFDKIDIDQLKEEMLETGYYGFEFDW